METFVAVVHILVAISLVSLVLIQDSKGGAMGGAFGGGTSSSILGATGAATLAQKLTRWTAVVFAGTCIFLSIMATRSNKSVIDAGPVSTAPSAAATATPGTAAKTEGAGTTANANAAASAAETAKDTKAEKKDK